MLSQGKTMEIAELYDLTHSYSTTAQLAGVDPKTVKRALARRAAGYPPETRERGSVADPYLDKIDEWIERSSGLVRADVVLLAQDALERCWAAETERHRALAKRIAEDLGGIGQ